MLASMVVVVSIGAITFLDDESGSYLVQTGSDIGTPRELAAEIDPDLPDPPDWLSVPPPPTTATTVASTTTTTTTVASTTTITTTSSTTVAPTTTTVATTTTTTTASYPTGSVLAQGYLHSRQSPWRCFDAQSPGVTGSSIKASFCVGAWAQEVKAVGAGSIVALQFTDPPNANLCFSASGGNLVLAPCDGQPWQLFDVITRGSWYTLESRSSGRCLESRSNGLELRNCSPGASNREQQFNL